MCEETPAVFRLKLKLPTPFAAGGLFQVPFVDK
jgi:hypothetical protein